MILAMAVLVAGFLLDLSRDEWFWIILCITMVVGAEMINTAVEVLTDLVSPEFNKQAGKVKDLAAGAVLLAAMAAAIVGSWIFLPKILEFINGSAGGGY